MVLCQNVVVFKAKGQILFSCALMAAVQQVFTTILNLFRQIPKFKFMIYQSLVLLLL